MKGEINFIGKIQSSLLSTEKSCKGCLQNPTLTNILEIRGQKYNNFSTSYMHSPEAVSLFLFSKIQFYSVERMFFLFHKRFV